MHSPVDYKTVTAKFALSANQPVKLPIEQSLVHRASLNWLQSRRFRGLRNEVRDDGTRPKIALHHSPRRRARVRGTPARGNVRNSTWRSYASGYHFRSSVLCILPYAESEPSHIGELILRANNILMGLDQYLGRVAGRNARGRVEDEWVGS